MEERRSAFDPEAWAMAQDVYGELLGPDPQNLSTDSRRAIAERLVAAGWSMREAAAAIGVGKSTVGRWTAAAPVASVQDSGAGGGLVGLLFGAGAAAALLKVYLDSKSPNPSSDLRVIRRPVLDRKSDEASTELDDGDSS